MVPAYNAHRGATAPQKVPINTGFHIKMYLIILAARKVAS